jgi:hypothetical protein
MPSNRDVLDLHRLDEMGYMHSYKNINKGVVMTRNIANTSFLILQLQELVDCNMHVLLRDAVS